MLDLLNNINELWLGWYKADDNGEVDTGEKAIIEECAKIYYFPPEMFNMLESILQEALTSSEEKIVIDVELVDSTDVVASRCI